MATKIVAQKAIATAFGALALFAAVSPGEAQTQERRPNGFALKELTTPEEIAAAKPNPQAPGFRVPLPPLDQMDPAMREDYVTNATRLKIPVPPSAPMMLTPEIKNAVTGVLVTLGKSGLPDDLMDLVVTIVARNWGEQLEWWVHAPQAVAEGVPADAIEAIRTGKTPKFTSDSQNATYHYVVELLRDHKVSDATFERLRGILGTKHVIALTVLVGHYSTVAFTHIASNLPLRAGVTPPLPPLANPFPAASK